jgi:hypothetical protein
VKGFRSKKEALATRRFQGEKLCEEHRPHMVLYSWPRGLWVEGKDRISMATTRTVKELNTEIENAVSIERVNGDKAEFTVQHYGDVRQFSVAIFDAEENPSDQVELSLTEAKHLRALLNSAPVAALLETAE